MRKLHFQADLRRLFLDWFTKKITVTCSFEEETEISRCREKSWFEEETAFSGRFEEKFIF